MKHSLSTLVLLVTLTTVIFGPYFVRIDPQKTNPEKQLASPDSNNPLGTDLLGRDVLSRTLYGGRQTLLTAGLAALLSAIIGVPIGGAAGMWVKRVGRVLMLMVSAFLAVPSLVVALVVLTLIGRGTLPLVIALGVSQIAPFAYITRSAVQVIHAESYVDAAISMGATPLHILRNHLLPNVLPTILPYLGVVFSYTVLSGAALSFLGVGNEPGTPDWGVMLAEGRTAFRSAPWIGVASGAAITLTVWAVNDLADQLTSRSRAEH